ncbi:MAG: metallophosphoesterase [Candidatus Helarchaeota archaeon]
MKNSNPMIIIMSDTHLGASGARVKLIQEFIHKILDDLNNNEGFKNDLKAFIILGDIFDLVCDSYKDIVHDYKEILEDIDAILNHGVAVVLTLGNHDISVSGNLDKKFLKQKRKLIKKFKEINLNAKFLNELTIGQYLYIHNNTRGWEISIYNKKNIFDSNPINTITLQKTENLSKKFHILLTHGHQFFPEKTKLASSIWDFCLSAPDIIKEFFNYLWNVVLKREKTNEPINLDDELEKNQEILEKKFNLKLKSRKKKVIMKYYTNFKDIDNYRDQLINSEAKIKEVLGDTEITHIIFGHTHKVEILKEDNRLIYNTGAWQHVNPSYAEFYSDGTIKIKILNDNGEWEDYN